MPATAVPSTAPKDEEGNPLAESLAKITGKSPLSKATGTSTGVIGYDPAQTFRPSGDAISVVTTPGTGATTAESWSHDIALENQRQQALQFEYQQQQDTLANAMKEAAATQAAQQQAFSQGITSAQAAREAQSAAQQAALAPVNLKSAQQALQTAAYDQQLKKSQAEAAAAQTWQQLGGMTLAQAQQAREDQSRYAQFTQNRPITQDTYSQFLAYYNSPNYNSGTPQYYKPSRATNNVFQASDAGL
jgi:hypothetical protein